MIERTAVARLIAIAVLALIGQVGFADMFTEEPARFRTEPTNCRPLSLPSEVVIPQACIDNPLAKECW